MQAIFHTWVINLDRAPDRLQHIGAQLERLGLPWTRFSAVDANILSVEQRALLDSERFFRQHGMLPTPGELACYLSHLQVMRLFLASSAEYAVILEDDVIINPSLPDALLGLIKHAQRWDMVKLSAVHSGTPAQIAQIAPGSFLAVMLSQCTGSSAYILNRLAATQYLEKLLPVCLPYDHAFDRGWRLGIKVRMVTPTPCIHFDGFNTTLGLASPSRKPPKYQRLPMVWYRLGNELQRLRYGLSQLYSERCVAARADFTH